MLKFELQAILVIVTFFAGLGWLATQVLINKARERGLIDKAKLELTSFSFWHNVFAVIGVIAVVLFVLNLFWSSDSARPWSGGSD